MRVAAAGLLLALSACERPVAQGAPDAGPEAETEVGTDAGADAGADAGQGDGGAACFTQPAATSDFDRYQRLLACLRASGASALEKQGAVDGFVPAVEASGGFPIVSGGQTVFFYVQSAAWDAAAAALQPEGFGVYHLALPLEPTATSRWRYKLVAHDAAGNDVWFSDPLSRRFQYDALGRYSLVRGGADVGHLEWIRKVSARQLGVDRAITLYVPRGYDFASKRYPVLYLHDGNNAFDPNQPRSVDATWDADAVADAEISAGRVREFIVVAIPNDDRRFFEYGPVEDLFQGQHLGGDGDAYADFVVNDLKPVVDASYRTLPGRDDTAVLGSSMGGLISYHLGLTHPEVFRGVGGMSSAFGWGSGLGNLTELDRYAATAGLAARAQVFYLDSGNGSPSGGCPAGTTVEANLANDFYCWTLEMKATLEQAGVNTYPLDPNAALLEPADVDLYHWWEPGALHSEPAWNARLFRPLRLFFRP